MFDLNTHMLDQNGESVKQNFKKAVMEKGKVKEVNDYREITLKDIIRIALLKNYDEAELNPSQVLSRYKLFRKIYNEGNTDLDKNEKDLLSNLICKSHEILFAGQAIELINQ